MFLVFVALASGHAHASPIQPDIRRLVEEPQGPPQKFEPARAGWNGPESASPAGGTTRELLQAAQVRAVRRTLALAVIPDPKALGAIFLLIVLLRKMRITRERKPEAPSTPSAPAIGAEWQMPQAA
jgi:hypothetical protein